VFYEKFCRTAKGLSLTNKAHKCLNVITQVFFSYDYPDDGESYRNNALPASEKLLSDVVFFVDYFGYFCKVSSTFSCIL
jgi:hypothetical protein